MKAPKKKFLLCAVIASWAVLCWAFFQLDYSYHFFFKEQNQLFLPQGSYIAAYLERPAWLASVIGDFLTQLYYYRYAGAITLTVMLLLLGDIARRALQALTVPFPWAMTAAVILMTIEAVLHLDHAYPLSSTTAKIMLLLTLWLSVRLWRKRRTAMAIPIVLFLLVTIPYHTCYAIDLKQYAGKIKGPEWTLERDLAADCEYYFGNYDKVISMVKKTPREKITPRQMFFYYLAYAGKGSLPDHLLDMTEPVLGTFYTIGPSSAHITINNMNELYWALGDMTFTERAAMMAAVFSPRNRNARMTARLAEVNIVSGDTAAADKYLRILSRTLTRRRWALTARDNPKYAAKRLFINKTDTIVTNDNCHTIMMQLLDSNKDNKTALDYMLCSDLLLKDMDSFKRDYDRYAMTNTAANACRLYQEALCVWLAGTNAAPEIWKKYIHRRDVIPRFRDYNYHRGDSRYKNTYWYYFDTHKQQTGPPS